MTIIDALVVELGLDASDLAKKAPVSIDALKKLEGQGDKTEKSVKKISSTSKETARSVSDLSRVVTSFLAIIGGTVAIKSFIADFIETNAQLDRLSKNLGINVSTISAWSNAAEKLGGSAQGLQGTFDMLSKSQTQLMLTGESNLIPYLSALGVSLADAEGKARPVTDILLDLADRFSGMDRTEANNFGRMMGIDQGTMNLLLQGRKELELEIRRQREQAAVTKAQAEEASKLQKQIIGVKQTFASLGRTLLMDAAPTLEKVFGYLEKFGEWAIANKDFIADFLKVLAVGLGAIALVTVPIDLAVLAVIALAAAIALLWQDYQVWAKGGKSAFDWGSFAEGIQVVVDAMKALGEAAKTAWNWVSKVLGKSSSNDGAGHLGTTMDHGGKKTTVDPITKQKVTSTSSANPDDIRVQAKKLAHVVSLSTGIPEDLIYAQWAHETNDFTNRGARELNNLAGINVPGGKGQDYRKFDNLADFAKYYSFLMRPDGLYPNASKAKTPEDLAAALKSGGYYADTQSNYAAGIRRFDSKAAPYSQLLSGISGASSLAANAPGGTGSGQSNVDRSVKTTIDTINVQTQAIDAQGMARDLERSLDFLFVTQANSGLN